MNVILLVSSFGEVCVAVSRSISWARCFLWLLQSQGSRVF